MYVYLFFLTVCHSVCFVTCQKHKSLDLSGHVYPDIPIYMFTMQISAPIKSINSAVFG